MFGTQFYFLEWPHYTWTVCIVLLCSTCRNDWNQSRNLIASSLIRNNRATLCFDMKQGVWNIIRNCLILQESVGHFSCWIPPDSSKGRQHQQWHVSPSRWSLWWALFDVMLKSIWMHHPVSIAECMNNFFTTLGPNNSLPLFNKVLKVRCINIKWLDIDKAQGKCFRYCTKRPIVTVYQKI